MRSRLTIDGHTTMTKYYLVLLFLFLFCPNRPKSELIKIYTGHEKNTRIFAKTEIWKTLSLPSWFP